MCFGRLIGAATGLEVAWGGAREWVEGEMDKKTGTSEWDEQQKKKSFRVSRYFFIQRENNIDLHSRWHGKQNTDQEVEVK